MGGKGIQDLVGQVMIDKEFLADLTRDPARVLAGFELTADERAAIMIRSPKITAAKLVYFTPESVDETLAHARRLLANAGWVEMRSERFVNPEKFPGVWAEFSKGEDICRLTVIEGSGATHVDYTLARVNPGS